MLRVQLDVYLSNYETPAHFQHGSERDPSHMSKPTSLHHEHIYRNMRLFRADKSSGVTRVSCEMNTSMLEECEYPQITALFKVFGFKPRER